MKSVKLVYKIMVIYNSNKHRITLMIGHRSIYTEKLLARYIPQLFSEDNSDYEIPFSSFIFASYYF